MWLYEELAKFALAKLKPGGSLVFYYNRLKAPELHAIFAKYAPAGLTYWWSFAVVHGGGIGARVHVHGVIPMWKHALWFVKGKNKAGIKDVRDRIDSVRQSESKMIHQWAQSRVEAEYLTENLTISKDSVVCDPFMGSGEFVIGAAKQGRYVIGVEKDKEVYEKAVDYIKSELDSAL